MADSNWLRTLPIEHQMPASIWQALCHAGRGSPSLCREGSIGWWRHRMRTEALAEAGRHSLHAADGARALKEKLFDGGDERFVAKFRVAAARMKIERVNVLGVGISALNMELARQAITEALRTKAKGYICVT